MAYADYNDLMTFTEELLVKVAQDIGLGKWKFLKVIDCELANAVQGITILACWPFAYNKPFTQFEAYYVMLCNTSFVWHELTRLFKTSLDLSNLVDANWQDCSKQVMTSLKQVKTCLKDFTNRYVVFSNWQDCLWQFF